MKPIALITGATSGIGEACAHIFADKFSLILCGRRTERLEKLKKALSVKTDVHTLTFDVRDKEVVFKSIQNLPPNWQDISLLINNAGNAHGLDYIQEGDPEDWDAMMDINVKGLLYVTKAVLPTMIERKQGHIINVGSVAGVDVYPRGNVYNASKFAVDALTKGMRMDLLEQGIKVSEIKPGLVETEFSEVRFKGDKERAAKVYQGAAPLTARDVAETVYFMATRPAGVNIADVLILPSTQASSTMIKKD
jgi:NADP-dependent 3-hydroxy acid dehydrogenase YdfG